MSAKIKIQNSWVFSPQLDFISFVLPFFVALFFVGTKYNSVNNYWLSFFLAKIFIGGGHIFATYIPLNTTDKIKKRLNVRFYLTPIIFVSIYAIANFISDTAFMNLLAISGLLHIYLQHFAWMKMSQGQTSAKRKKIERSFFLILLGVPNLIWFLRQLSNAPSYLYGITITQAIPNFNIFTLPILSLFTIACILMSVALSITKDETGNIVLNFGKFLFFMATVVWMCAGLFFIKSLGFFHVYLAISHGTGYMVYISEGWPKHLNNGIWNSKFRLLIVATVALIFGGLWVGSFYLLKNLPNYLIFLPWIPLIIHYGYDSEIWRRPRTLV